MKFATAIRLGFARTRRRFGLVLLAYLAALLPALLLISFVHHDFSESFDKSLFAGRVLEGQRFGAMMDYRVSRDYDLGPVSAGLGGRALLVLLLQIVVSAGLVEALLQRSGPGERPFLAGVGRHSWRFLRSALGFLALVGIAAAVVGGSAGRLREFASDRGDGSLWFWGTAVLFALMAVFLIPAKLGYDLSRLAAASHGDGATFRGLLRATRHAFGRPAVLWPLLLAFAVPGLLLIVGYAAWRDVWDPTGTGTLVLVIVLQQAILFAHAWLRVGLWGSEIAYYQGIGEPRWCLPKPKKVKPVPVAPLAAPVAAPLPAPETAPEPVPLAEPIVDPIAEEPPTQPLPETGWGLDTTPVGDEPATLVLRPTPTREENE